MALQPIMADPGDGVLPTPVRNRLAANLTDPAQVEGAALADGYGLTLTVDALGAVGDGTTDDTTVIQGAMDSLAALGGGTLRFTKPNGSYAVTGLLIPANVALVGPNTGFQSASGCKIKYIGTAGGTVIGPQAPSTNTFNTTISNLFVDGNSLADIGISMYRTSYSHLTDISVFGMRSGGVCILFDSNVSDQCYFNIMIGVKVSGSGAIGARFQNGANANLWLGGVCISLATGMEFLSLSGFNNVIGTDFENMSVKMVYLDAPSNVFTGCHMEVAPIGFDVTALGNDWRETGTTGSSLTTFVQDASAYNTRLGAISASESDLNVGYTKVRSVGVSGSTSLYLDPKTANGTADMYLNLFRFVNTSGIKQFAIYKGDNTGTRTFQVDPTTGNVVSAGTVELGGNAALYSATAAPASGTWTRGSRVLNSAASVGAPKGWICTVAGTPGTWVSEGNL